MHNRKKKRKQDSSTIHERIILEYHNKNMSQQNGSYTLFLKEVLKHLVRSHKHDVSPMEVDKQRSSKTTHNAVRKKGKALLLPL